MDELKAVLRDPRCYRRAQPDDAPDASTVEPVPIAGVRYIIAEEKQPLGVFLLHEKSESLADVHFTLLPPLWGKSQEVGTAFLAWVWSNTAYLKLIARVPSYNPLALRLAVACGFEEDVITKHEGSTKHGQPYSMHWLHIYRPEEYAKCA